MTLFLCRTALFYIVEHAYLFWSFYRLSGRRRAVFWLTLPWFLCMGLFPLLLHVLPEGSAQQALAFTVKQWLPLAYFGALAFVAWDGLRLALRLLRRFFPEKAFTLPRHVCLAGLAICACIFGYGIHEAHTPRVTRLELPTDKLPRDTDRVRVAFAADLHIGPQTGIDMLRRTVDDILKEQPEYILLGGDILDDATQGSEADIEELRRLHAPYGVYAVLGNHDAFGPVEDTAAFLQRANITLLSADEAAVGPLRIIGVDDPAAGRQRGPGGLDPMPLLCVPDPARYTVLLEHRPTLRKQSIGLFDLQLSGHTHAGQVFPLKPLMRLKYGVPSGLSSHTSGEGESLLYITTGTGFSKLPIRLFTPPEVVIIDLVPLASENDAAVQPEQKPFLGGNRPS